MERRIDGRRGQMQKALYSKKTADECRICCSCLKMCGRCGIMGWKSKGRGGKRVKRSSTDTCCLTLPLKLEKWQSDRLEKRFEIGRQIYNTIVHAELKKLRKLERTQQYQEIEQKLENAKQEETKELWKKKRQLLDQNGLSENHFKADMKHYYPHFKDNIASSVAVHGIASQAWTAFEKVLLSKDGKMVHFKKKGELSSLRGYSQAGKSGGIEIIFRGSYVEWKGLKLPLKLSPDNDYETEMLSKRVKYVRILRKDGKTKTHWYAQLALEGKPAVKRDSISGAPKHPVGHGVVGIDIGTRTLAYSADSKVDLIELADRVQNIEQEKMLLQRKLDRSRRATNPENYKPDGTIKKGVKLTRNKSKRYRKIQHQLAMLQHRQADIRKRQHNELANYLLTLGDCFFVEDMDYRALTRKAKKTEISEKTGRYKRKKRFGKSIANKAPSMLIALLDQKCKSLNLEGVKKVDTAVKASQYNHQTDECKAKELKERWNIMPDGERIQRDLYSAFLLQHCRRDLPEYNRKKLQETFGNELYRVFDREALQRDYPKFVEYHRETIQRLSALPKTIASMGIRRSIS